MVTITEPRPSFAELRTWSREETGDDWKWAWVSLDLYTNKRPWKKLDSLRVSPP